MKEVFKAVCPLHVIIERIHECMRLGLRRDGVQYDMELTKIVDEFGVDLVSQHACEETWAGGKYWR